LRVSKKKEKRNRDAGNQLREKERFKVCKGGGEKRGVGGN
jgi:hypothetical protein